MYRRDARQARERTAGRPEGHDVKVFLENCTTFGKMQGIKRHEKRMKSVKLQTENKHRTFTLALQRRMHSACAKTRAFRARNDVKTGRKE